MHVRIKAFSRTVAFDTVAISNLGTGIAVFLDIIFPFKHQLLYPNLSSNFWIDSQNLKLFLKIHQNFRVTKTRKWINKKVQSFLLPSVEQRRFRLPPVQSYISLAKFSWLLLAGACSVSRDLKFTWGPVNTQSELENRITTCLKILERLFH